MTVLVAVVVLVPMVGRGGGVGTLEARRAETRRAVRFLLADVVDILIIIMEVEVRAWSY